MFERFSCFKEEDGLIKFSNDGLNTGNELCSNSPVDKKAFFDTFGRIVRDDREYTNFSPSLLPTLAAIRTKPFLLLAGISGTGKSRIVRRLAQASTTAALEELDEETLENRRFDIHSPANFQLIQVKPNWHNSMEVVGYQTNIPQPRYVFTPFVEFVAKAWQHPDVPFFLCLDEMNLAPVEEYFAEFLSAIESRSKNADGLFSTDPIIKPFDNFGAAVCEQMIVDLFPGKNVANAAEEPLRSIIARFKTKGLSLPENLIVIGTVNMDETTFSFSRKVLDRAMSFEMNEVDFDSLLQGQADVVNAPLPTTLLNLLTNRPVDAAEVTELIDAERIVNYLKALNQVLGGTPFKLGYRAANECLLYVAAAKDLGRDDATAALDEFTLMKVLSRIEGDTTKLQADGDDTLLSQLKTVIEAQLGTPAETNGSDTDGVEETDATLEEKPQLQCVAKLERMMLQLQRNSFVSYWE